MGGKRGTVVPLLVYQPEDDEEDDDYED